MQITYTEATPTSKPTIGEIKRGEVFQLIDGRGVVYMKTDLKEWNAVVLETGQLVEISRFTEVRVLKAHLTVSE